MKYGLSDQQLKEITDILASYEAVEKAVLFGSRAIDTYKEASDVDIAIKGGNADWSLAMTIKDHLEEETYLPFFFDVVAYGSVESKELRRHIDGKGKVLFERGSEGVMENGELSVENGGSVWREVRLGDVGTVITGKTPMKKNLQDWGDFMPFITPSDYKNYRKKAFSSERKLSEIGAERLGKKILPKNAVLVTCIGSDMGKVVLNDVEVITNQQINSIIPNEEIVDNDFLYYRLVSMYETLRVYGSDGTAVPIVNKGDFENLKTDFPPLPEQKTIAEVLSALDDKIDLLHRQNKTLEQMAETLFRQWFVVEAGEDWEEGVLGDVAVNVRNSVKTPEIKDDTKYVGLEHIDRRNISLNQYGSGVDVNSNKSAFEEKDILFGKLRPYFHKVCMSPFSGICSTDILVIRPTTPVHFIYCLFAFFQNDVVEYANLGSGGTRMPRTNWETLKQYPIAMPEKNIISKFNQIVEPDIDKILKNIKQISTLQSLRDTLLPKLMSGEVRVEQ